ncbi:F-box domain-containing protein [Cephalotus follicularis]|uniref:F-box domain-containing protein n=1 Tax=Cephalotus follicularis TaxID=3775 RepID=A0A1Q3CWF7_CEPFO|nr:F-box domain-containing protein [Cephalotus follicularis]
MAEMILQYRETLPEQLKSTFASLLSAQRPHFPEFELGSEDGPSLEPNPPETGDTQTPLICGLPDDIAFFCLARVPRKYHAVLKCVSRRWRDLVCSDEWHAHRIKHNLHENLDLCFVSRQV